jgi:methionine aminotransferase
MTRELRKVHQFMVFAVNTPAQHGIAAYLADPSPWQELSAFYQAKRDAFRAGLAATRFEPLACEGAYFQCVRYDAVADLAELEFAQWLTREVGVAAIPVSAFLRRPSTTRVVRFCFAKREETLAAALERLARL